MRSYTLTAIILGLLALLLVLAAAFVFLFQADIRLRDQARASLGEADALRQAQAETELRLGAAEATRDTTAAALATSEAAGLLLESSLVDSRLEVDALSTQVSDLSGELESVKADLLALQDGQKNAPPLAWVISPADADILPIDQPVTILIAAADRAGLTSVTLRIDDEEYSTYAVDGQTYFWRSVVWAPPAAAEATPAAATPATIEDRSHTVSVYAVNSNNIRSEPTTLTFTLADIEARNRDIRAEVERNVVSLRGLEPLAPVVPLTLSRDAMRQRIADDFAEDHDPDADRLEVIEFAAFDFLPRDYDLHGVMSTLYSENVLGFYDPETAEFVVVSDDVVLDAAAQWTHAHEFVHALQDQHYALEQINDDALDSEARAALRALAEGEAELVQYLYLINDDFFDQAEVDSIINGNRTADTSSLETLPTVLLSNIAFPYVEGSAFAEALYRRGGFAAIDRAWANPPTTTEHILHPDRYLAGDPPQLVSLAPLTDTLGAGWQMLDSDIFGEFFLRQYLAQQLSRDQVSQAATGWGGDRYAVYYNTADDALVMALRLVWDTPRDAAEFARLYPRYPAALFGSEGEQQPDGSTCWAGADVICLMEAEGESLIARAPDLQTAAAVLATIAAGGA